MLVGVGDLINCANMLYSVNPATRNLYKNPDSGFVRKGTLSWTILKMSRNPGYPGLFFFAISLGIYDLGQVYDLGPRNQRFLDVGCLKQALPERIQIPEFSYYIISNLMIHAKPNTPFRIQCSILRHASHVDFDVQR